MQPFSRTHFSFFAAVALLGALVTRTGHAQNIYFVGKNQTFAQTSVAGAIPDSSRAFEFVASAPIGATLTLPAGGTQTLTKQFAGDDEFAVEQYFPTKAALDGAYPNGTYRMSGTGIPSLSFNLTTDAFPAATPQVIGGNWNAGGLFVADPAQVTTINLSTFTGYANTGVAGLIAVSVEGLNGDSGIDDVDIVSVANPFGLPVTTVPLNTITIPAGRLTNGRVYEVFVEFLTLTTLDTTTVAGGGVVASFGKQLRFYLAAQSAGTTTPPPVIVSQPANATGPLGGSVTINLGLTVGGSNQFTNVASRWFFNGQEINLGGGKYSFSPTGFGLVVNNLTAADAGAYSVKLVNAGGIVNSGNTTLAVAVPGPPTIASHPQSHTVAPGSTVVLSVGASAVPAPSFQWRLNGNPVPGQMGPTLFINGAGPANAGTYTVVVSNTVGSSTSLPATLTLGPAAANNPGRLGNLSILTPLAAGETMTMGTVLGGGGTSGAKPLLARAAGPSLAQLGVSAFLPDPTMALVNTSASPAVTVATNDDWAGTASLSTAFAAVGAFAYVGPLSKDAAIFQSGLSPGNYTVQVNDAGTGAGAVIAELYDATPTGAFTAATTRLVNVSVLKTIGAGASLTVGFYIGGTTSKTVLIRAIGPTLGLAPFNIPGSMPDPQLTLYNSSQAIIAANNDWGGSPQIANIASRIGAFAVASGTSRDAMLLVTLTPGTSYTAQVNPFGSTAGGTAIVEVYEVP
jgi:hypothetical protein